MAQIWKVFNTTAQATGAPIWTPAAGKKIQLTSLQLGTYGSTPARLQLWFGASGDTIYTPGTDQLVFPMSYVPSANGYPGSIYPLYTPIFCNNPDYILRITTDGALSVDVIAYGNEF